MILNVVITLLRIIFLQDIQMKLSVDLIFTHKKLLQGEGAKGREMAIKIVFWKRNI